jgi:hypothetical protein
MSPRREAALRVHGATTELSLGGPRVRILLPPANSTSPSPFLIADDPAEQISPGSARASCRFSTGADDRRISASSRGRGATDYLREDRELVTNAQCIADLDDKV